MEMDCPEFLRKLCAIESIRRLSHYVERSPWGLRHKNFEDDFHGKMGLYCFWWSGPRQRLLDARRGTGRSETQRWSGPRQRLLDALTQYQYKGEHYPAPGFPRLVFRHNYVYVPLYVGMTTRAANRMHQRLIDFTDLMSRWLTKESRMSKFAQLFGYPERICARIAPMVGKTRISVDEARTYVIANKHKCQAMIDELQKDYHSLLYDHFSISFVPFEEEADLFYAEALSIGLLRPPLNLG